MNNSQPSNLRPERQQEHINNLVTDDLKLFTWTANVQPGLGHWQDENGKEILPGDAGAGIAGNRRPLAGGQTI